MYDINEVTQVNTSFIFFHFSDGSQDRKVVDMRELKYLYDDVCQNMKHYDFMKNESHNISEKMQEEYNKLESISQGYKDFIEKNQDIPAVRRNLHDVCYQLEVTQQKQRETAIQKSGVNVMYSHAIDKYWKLYKLQKQIESVLKSK